LFWHFQINSKFSQTGYRRNRISNHNTPIHWHNPTNIIIC